MNETVREQIESIIYEPYLRVTEKAQRILALPIRTVTETCNAKGRVEPGQPYDWIMKCEEGHPYEAKRADARCPVVITRTITLAQALDVLEKIASRYHRHQKYRPMHDLDLDDLLKGWTREEERKEER